MSSFQAIIKSELKNKQYIKAFNYKNKLKNVKGFIKEEDNAFLNSINLNTIEKIIMKYTINNKSYINNIIDANIISTYLYNSKKLESFIHLNGLTINDFIPIVLNSKIILCQNENCIYKQGDEYLGFYVLLKGNIKVKVSKLNCILDINPEYKEEILKEYNLDISEVSWIDNNNNHTNKRNKSINHNFHFKNKSSIFHPEISLQSKRNSLRSSLISFSRKSINNINIEYSTERDLFIYNSKNNLYFNNNNETLIFGGIHLFNEYMIDITQIHLSSVYSCSNNESNNKKNKIKFETILLYFREDSLKEIRGKIIFHNKERIKFLSKKLLPISKMSPFDFSSFLSNIKLIYIHINEKKDIRINNNIFYLIYKGECHYDDSKYKNIIYDEGDFLFLNNIFEDNKNNNKIITFYTKSSNTIIFQINLSVLSNNNLILMKKFLWDIYENQYNIRINYHINKIKYHLNFKSNKEKEKEKKKYFILCSNKLLQLNSYKKLNNNKKKKFNNTTSYLNCNKKKIPFLIYSFDKNCNHTFIHKNNSSSNLVKFKITKKNNKIIETLHTSNKRYHSKNESFSDNKYNRVINNKSDSFKNISTKNSTNSKVDINRNIHSSNILYNYATKINRFNANTSKLKDTEIGKTKKYIRFISNFGNNGNNISSLILSKDNLLKENNKNENIETCKKKNKGTIKNYFHKKLFFSNINQSINILKYVYHKDITEKHNNRQYFQKNRKFSSLISNRICNYINSLKSNNLNISI